MIATEVIKMLRNEAKGIEITSIFSHSNKEKALTLAKENDIDHVYTDYAQLLKEDDADFVYIALVNNAHNTYMRQALEAQRNVIVEKPFTSTLEEAKLLAQMARERGLYLFEAVTPLHTPNFQLVKQSLKRIAPYISHNVISRNTPVNTSVTNRAI